MPDIFNVTAEEQAKMDAEAREAGPVVTLVKGALPRPGEWGIRQEIYRVVIPLKTKVLRLLIAGDVWLVLDGKFAMCPVPFDAAMPELLARMAEAGVANMFTGTK